MIEPKTAQEMPANNFDQMVRNWIEYSEALKGD